MPRPNLEFVHLLVPKIIGCTLKNWAVPGYAHAPFSPKFFMGFVRMDPVNVSAVALPVPEIIGIGFLGWGCEPPMLGP